MLDRLCFLLLSGRGPSPHPPAPRILHAEDVGSSLSFAEWNKHKINIVDTPGIANFLSDSRAALRVVELAAVIVDAVAGVEVSTEKMWAGADELELPRLVVLNRLDCERASLDRSLESLLGLFGRAVVPIQLPIGEEKHFKGIVDLVAMKALTFAADGSGKATEADISAGSQGQGASRPRCAHRAGGRSRRHADGEVL